MESCRNLETQYFLQAIGTVNVASLVTRPYDSITCPLSEQESCQIFHQREHTCHLFNFDKNMAADVSF